MASTAASQIRQELQRVGLRCTPQRYAMLQYLMRQAGHPTADQIFRAINRSDPRSSRATIYNSLHALTEAGVVSEVALDAGPVRYEATQPQHHHFVCERCRSLEDIAAGAVSDQPRRLRLGGRQVRKYQIVFRGLCEKCCKKQLRNSCVKPALRKSATRQASS